MINPILYRVGCSVCGGLTILPLDVAQTKFLSDQPVSFKFAELKWMLMVPLLFTIQNTVYTNCKFIKNDILRAAVAGTSAAPPYILLEIKKMQLRLNLLPDYKKFITWIIIRQVVVYVTMYTIFQLKIQYANFLAALIANTLGFPLRLIAFKTGYKTLIMNWKSIKNTAIIEVIKSALGDGITLYLVYNFKF